MKEPQSLLEEYVQNRSEEAFERLMKGYVDLVYSTALRLVRGDSHLAEDVTQTVFLQFAKKANRLPPDVMLGGWLHQTTCFVAVGERLGSSENAAQKRVSRALDELHSILLQRGIGLTLSAAALGTALAARAVEAAPAEVVASLAKAGLAGAAAGHGTALTYLKAMITSKAGLSRYSAFAPCPTGAFTSSAGTAFRCATLKAFGL